MGKRWRGWGVKIFWITSAFWPAHSRPNAGLARRARQHPDWKPFTGPLAPSSIRQALTILGALFQYLLDAGYLHGNPLALARRQKRGLAQPPGVERYLDAELWQVVQDTLEALPRSGARDLHHYERARWLFHLLYLTGARRTEVARAVIDRKSTRLNSSHLKLSRMPSSA